MDPNKKPNIDTSDIHDLYGHNDLKGFANYIGVNYKTFLEINKKNAQVMNEHKKTEN